MKKKRALGGQTGEETGLEQEDYDPKKDNMLIMRIIGPVITFVDRPWKVCTLHPFLFVCNNPFSFRCILSVFSLVLVSYRGFSILACLVDGICRI